MKKGKLLLAQFRLNVISNIFFILQCVLVFLVLNFTVSTLAYDGYVGKYGEFDEDATIFLSNAVANRTPSLDARQFFQLVDEIRAVEGVGGVGYYMQEYFVSDKQEDMITDALILSDDMAGVRYPLSQGQWFEKEGSGTQVILGGGIAKQYQTGETITLQKLEASGGTTRYVPVSAKVIGKLKEPAFAIDLNFGSSRPVYGSLFERYQDIILSNGQTLLSDDPEQIMHPSMSLLVFAKKGADMEALKEKLSAFGQPFDFREIDRFTQESIADSLANGLPAAAIMAFGILFGLAGITWLGIYQNMRTLSVYHLYGMSRKGCAFLNTALDAAMVGVSLICALLLTAVPAVHSAFFGRALIGLWNLAVTFAFAALAVGISFLIGLGFSKESPLRLLRRFE